MAENEGKDVETPKEENPASTEGDANVPSGETPGDGDGSGDPPGFNPDMQQTFQEEEIDISEKENQPLLETTESQQVSETPTDVEGTEKSGQGEAKCAYQDLFESDLWANNDPVVGEEEEEAGGQQGGSNMKLLGAFRVKAEDDKEDLVVTKKDMKKGQGDARDIKTDEAMDKSMRKRKKKDARLFDRYEEYKVKKWEGIQPYVFRFIGGKCTPQDSVLSQHYPIFTEKLRKGYIKRVWYVSGKEGDRRNVEWADKLFIQFSDDSVYYRGKIHVEFTMKRVGIPGRWKIFLEQKRGDHAIASQFGKVKYINYRNIRNVFMSNIKLVNPGSTQTAIDKRKTEKENAKKYITAIGYNRHRVSSKSIEDMILGTNDLDLYYLKINLLKDGEKAKSEYTAVKIRSLMKDPSAPKRNRVTGIMIETQIYKSYIFVMVTTNFELYMFRGKRISETDPFRFISFSSLAPIRHKYKSYNVSPLRIFYRKDVGKEAASGILSKKKTTKKESRKGLTKKERRKRRQEEEEELDKLKETFYVPHAFTQLTTQGIIHGMFSFSKVEEDEELEKKKMEYLSDTGLDSVEDHSTSIINKTPWIHRGNLFVRDFEHLVFSEERNVDWLKTSDSKPIDVACTKYHILFFRKDPKRYTDLTVLHYPPDVCHTLDGNSEIKNNMVTLKRTFEPPYDDEYTAFCVSPYDESNVVMYGRYCIKSLIHFQEQRHMYATYFDRARKWRQIKKLYEAKKISYDDCQIHYELCRKYFHMVVKSIYYNQEKREELVILELGYFCMSCGWYNDAAIYFAATKKPVEEVMELFLEIDQHKHLRTYLMYKYNYRELSFIHPIKEKFNEVGYYNFNIMNMDEPECRSRSLSLIQMNTTIVELYLQELNDLIRKKEISVKTEMIEKEITKLKMELLTWLTKNLRVKRNINVNLIYKLMTSYGHFDIAFQFVLKCRYFEEVLTLWLEGKRGTDRRFDIFRQVVDHISGERDLDVLVKFAHHLFTREPTRTCQSLGRKPKLSQVSFLPSLTNYGEYISEDFDPSNPKYLTFRDSNLGVGDSIKQNQYVSSKLLSCPRHQRLGEIADDPQHHVHYTITEGPEGTEGTRKYHMFHPTKLTSQHVDAIINYYTDFCPEQKKLLRKKRKRLMLKLASTIQFYERGREYAKGQTSEIEVLINEILFLLYQKLGNPLHLLKLTDEVNYPNNLEFNIRNIRRIKIVTPFINMSVPELQKIKVGKYHAGDFVRLVRRLRAHEIMARCCHGVGLNLLAIHHAVYGAFLCRRLSDALKKVQDNKRFDLELSRTIKGFRFLQLCSQVANYPVLLDKNGEVESVGSVGDKDESEHHQRMTDMSKLLWDHIIRSVLAYNEPVSDLLREEKEKWMSEQFGTMKHEFQEFQQWMHAAQSEKLKPELEKKSGEVRDTVEDFNTYFDHVVKQMDKSETDSTLSDDENDESETNSTISGSPNQNEGGTGRTGRLGSVSLFGLGKARAKVVSSLKSGSELSNEEVLADMRRVPNMIPTSGGGDDAFFRQIYSGAGPRKKKKVVEDPIAGIKKDTKKRVKDLYALNLDFHYVGHNVLKRKHQNSLEMDEYKEFFFDLKEAQESNLNAFLKKRNQMSASKRAINPSEGQDRRSSKRGGGGRRKDGEGGEDGDGSDSDEMDREGGEEEEEMESEGESDDERDGKSIHKMKLKRRVFMSKDTNRMASRRQRKNQKERKERRSSPKIRIPTIRNLEDVKIEFLSRLMIFASSGGNVSSIFNFLAMIPEDTVIAKFIFGLEEALKHEHKRNEQVWSTICQYMKRDDEFSKPSSFIEFGGDYKCDAGRECDVEYILCGEDEIFGFNCGHMYHGNCLRKLLVGTKDLVNIAFLMKKSEDEEEVPGDYFKQPLMTDLSFQLVKFDDDDDDSDDDGGGDDSDDDDEEGILDMPQRLSQLQLKQVIKRLRDMDRLRDEEKGTYKSNDHKMTKVFRRILKRIELKRKKDDIMCKLCPLCSSTQISDIHVKLFSFNEEDDWKVPKLKPSLPPVEKKEEEGEKKSFGKWKEKVKKKKGEEEEGEEDGEEEKDIQEDEEEEGEGEKEEGEKKSGKE